MTLDEAITLLKFNNKHIADLKNDDLQQFAEWLEELKGYRENEGMSENVYKSGYAFGYSKAESDYHEQSEKDRNSSYNCGKEAGYNKAINDVLKTIDEYCGNQRYLVSENIRSEIEQLKVGEEDIG